MCNLQLMFHLLPLSFNFGEHLNPVEPVLRVDDVLVRSAVVDFGGQQDHVDVGVLLVEELVGN